MLIQWILAKHKEWFLSLYSYKHSCTYLFLVTDWGYRSICLCSITCAQCSDVLGSCGCYPSHCIARNF